MPPPPPRYAPAVEARTQRRLLSVLIGLGLGVGLALGGAAAYLEFSLGSHIRAERAALAGRLRGVGAAVVDDERALAAAPPFDPPGTAHDAGPWLNPRIDWSSGTAALEAYKKTHPTPSPSLEVPAKLRTIALIDELKKPKPDPDVLAADTSWMRGLAEFDHWDWERDSPSEIDGSLGLAMPLPGFSQLIAWSRVRLLQGAASDDPRPAAREVRQLARLAYSTETIIGVQIAVALLGMERTTYDAVRAAKGAAAVEGWALPSADVERRLKRVAWGVAALMNPMAPQEEAKPVLAAPVTPPAGFGQCAGLGEGLRMAHFARAYFDDGAFADRFRALGDALQASAPTCRLRRVREAWAAPGTRGALRGTVAELCEGQGGFCKMLYTLPGARAKAAQALLLMGAISPPGY